MTTSYPSAAEPGRLSAMIVYGLYLLSIPSLAVFALAGVIWAYVAREGAGPVARAHLEDQIRVWWVAFAWGVALAVLWLVGAVLTVILVGFAVWAVIGVLAFVVMLWFTIKALLGLLKLLDGRLPRGT